MTDENSSPEIEASQIQGLLTRHVFLDTEVYRGYGHNLDSAPLRELGWHISEEFLTLHITDITLSEIERQIREDAVKLSQEVMSVSRKLNYWQSRERAANLPVLDEIDGPLLGRQIFGSFHTKIRFNWKAMEHRATETLARQVFESYFQRRPPFDDNKSKEFPDAFVIAALADWCRTARSNMYVVSHDEAMQRAAEASGFLLPVPSLPELLQIATDAETPEITGWVAAILAASEVIEAIHQTIKNQIGWLGMVYTGEFPEGDVYEWDLVGEPEIEDFSVLSASKETVNLLLKLKAPLLVKLQYEDHSHAFYDREDRKWIGHGRSEMEFEDEPIIRLAVTIDRENETIDGIEFVTQDIYVSEPSDLYY